MISNYTLQVAYTEGIASVEMTDIQSVTEEPIIHVSAE